MLQRTREAIDSVRIRLQKEDPLYIATARLDLAVQALARYVADDEAQDEYELADQEWHAAYYNVVAEAHRRVGAHL